MFNQVIAILNFEKEDEAIDFYHDCENALPKSVTINPGQPNEQRGIIRRAECKHDENPHPECFELNADATPTGKL